MTLTPPCVLFYLLFALFANCILLLALSFYRLQKLSRLFANPFPQSNYRYRRVYFRNERVYRASRAYKHTRLQLVLFLAASVVFGFSSAFVAFPPVQEQASSIPATSKANAQDDFVKDYHLTPVAIATERNNAGDDSEVRMIFMPYIPARVSEFPENEAF
ncbi:MAG: hypothetical protein ACOX0A_04770 [Thermoguttaceae bacterium]|jgi:hypothetical protein